MRRASFYVGIVVLGTVGPLVLAFWGLIASGYRFEFLFLTDVLDNSVGWLSLLGVITFGGLIVASIESQALAIAILGSHLVGRPITVREAVQRARMVFWSLVAASLIVSIPTTIVQNMIGEGTQQGLILGFVIGILVQAPFVYAAAGIVLGGVGAVEALKRSVRIVRARKLAAVILAILPTAFALLVLIGLEAGLDVVIRSVEALGLGTDSGPVGLAILTILVVVVVFALGTLLLTAAGIIYAPQVVMFVGLTRATMGLDRVRPGGDSAVDAPTSERGRFRWLPRPMVAAMAFGGIGLAGFLATLPS